MKKDIYERITERIIEKLEKGVENFEMPFNVGINAPRNKVTGKLYRGINLIILESGEYATFKQIKELGGKVKKGAKAEEIIFWKLIRAEDEDTQEEISIPIARTYKVFKIGRDTTGIESTKINTKKYEHESIKDAENIIKNYLDKPKLTSESGRAFYNKTDDIVNVPKKEEFKNINRYYSTMFHELVHSTGAEKRLNRETITKKSQFADETYSKEELIAELGASMLCTSIGIEKETIDLSASYIDGWIKALNNDKTLIISASQQAQKACDYILGNEF